MNSSGAPRRAQVVSLWIPLERKIFFTDMHHVAGLIKTNKQQHQPRNFFCTAIHHVTNLIKTNKHQHQFNQRVNKTARNTIKFIKTQTGK